jgi:hypothetical protein
VTLNTCIFITAVLTLWLYMKISCTNIHPYWSINMDSTVWLSPRWLMVLWQLFPNNFFTKLHEKLTKKIQLMVADHREVDGQTDMVATQGTVSWLCYWPMKVQILTLDQDSSAVNRGHTDVPKSVPSSWSAQHFAAIVLPPGTVTSNWYFHFLWKWMADRHAYR